MTPRQRLGAGLLAGGALVLAILSMDRPAPAPAGSDPAWAELRALLGTAWDVGERTTRIPADWAAPRLGRLGVEAWLTTVPLPDDVRARLAARMADPGFVDELVPFVWFVKEM
jgi:hypothetical protein